MLKVLELFSGIGSQTQALKNIGVKHISTQCDIDKYAVNVYNQLHGVTPNLGDINKINPDDLKEGQWDLITYSFPCTDISLAGHQGGLAKNSGTRSSLLWECEKIFRKVKPKYLLMENVKNLVGKKFLPYFEEWLNVLKDMGYKNYWKVLNAKDFGVPQNRERVFCISILGEHKPYIFPEPKKLEKRLKDVLEENVSKRYYLSNDIIKKINFTNYEVELPNGKKAEIGNIKETTCLKEVRTDIGKDIRRKVRQLGQKDTTPRNKDSKMFVPQNNGLANCLMTSSNIDSLIIEPVKVMNPLKEKTEYGWHFEQNVYDKKGISRAIKSSSGGGNIPKIIELNHSPKHQQDMVQHKDGICRTIPAGTHASTPHLLKTLVSEVPFEIRKLTPKECWRLMGWKDEQIDKVKGISNCQLYKQAGNSIVVNVLEAIFKNLFYPEKIEKRGLF